MPLLPNNPTPPLVLLVDDSATQVAVIRDALLAAAEPVRLSVAGSLAEARAWLARNTPDLAIVDLQLPDGNGRELLPPPGTSPTFPIVIMTGQGNETEAVKALKGGALDYLIKSPVILSGIPYIIERALRDWGNIIERHRAEGALRESEERFRTVFSTAAAGMVVLAPSGRILQANPAMCAFLGYSEEELQQRTIAEVTHPEDRALTQQGYDEILNRTRESLHYEKRYLHKDGRIVWGHASVSCVRAVDGQTSYCVGLVQDISERRRMEEALREANRELDAFVHTVSHDLRAPLTPILGYAQYLKEHLGGDGDAESRHCLDQIVQQGERMLALMEDLLDLAKVGHLPLPAEPVDSAEVLRESMAGLAGAIVASGLTLQVGELPCLRLPRTLLMQLFDNLVGNAVRYAGATGGPIEIHGERSGALVRLQVRDHGPGIPEAERERIFTLFYRGSTGSALTGTGVGLATVEKIARLHGGRAWVEETPGGGSTFCVELLDPLTAS